MKELSFVDQKEITGGFALPFIITIIAVAAGINTARTIKAYYSVSRNR